MSSSTSNSLGRNSPCPCGSGRRFKRCHGIDITNADNANTSTYSKPHDTPSKTSRTGIWTWYTILIVFGGAAFLAFYNHSLDAERHARNNLRSGHDQVSRTPLDIILPHENPKLRDMETQWSETQWSQPPKLEELSKIATTDDQLGEEDASKTADLERPSADEYVFDFVSVHSELPNWVVYRGRDGCYAETQLSNGGKIAFGSPDRGGDIVVAVSPARDNGNRPSASKNLRLVFDGRNNIAPYWKTAIRGGRQFALNNFGKNELLRRAIARSAAVSIYSNDRQLVTVPLNGTTSAFGNIAECSATIPSERQSFDQVLSDRFCDHRPKNGAVLNRKDSFANTAHTLSVDNSSGGDAIYKVKRANGGSLYFTGFVHAGQIATTKGLKDGNYEVQFAYGEMLNEDCNNFVRPRPSKLDRTLDFNTSKERRGNKITTFTRSWTVSLYEVSGGNTKKKNISIAEFNDD